MPEHALGRRCVRHIAHEEQRHRRVMHDLVSDAAEHPAPQPAVGMSRHRDQRVGPLLGALSDHGGGRADARIAVGLDALGAQQLGLRGQIAVGVLASCC